MSTRWHVKRGRPVRAESSSNERHPGPKRDECHARYGHPGSPLGILLVSLSGPHFSRRPTTQASSWTFFTGLKMVGARCRSPRASMWWPLGSCICKARRCSSARPSNERGSMACCGSGWAGSAGRCALAGAAAGCSMRASCWASRICCRTSSLRMPWPSWPSNSPGPAQAQLMPPSNTEQSTTTPAAGAGRRPAIVCALANFCPICMMFFIYCP